MDTPKKTRRRLLYLGLGLAGVGAATAINQGLNVNSTQPIAVLDPVSSPTSAAKSIASAGGLPDFQGISQWLNSRPLSIADLKGKVGLIQFWTFACINCQRTLPYIVRWQQQYAAQGLQVIGIHTPEFAFERDVNNIKRALTQHQITYPVPIDNDYKTWNAYKNEYWPHLFLVDRQGVMQYDHIGEGAYDTTEQTIRKLLG